MIGQKVGFHRTGMEIAHLAHPDWLHWCSLYSLIRAVGRSENRWGRGLGEVIMWWG